MAFYIPKTTKIKLGTETITNPIVNLSVCDAIDASTDKTAPFFIEFTIGDEKVIAQFKSEASLNEEKSALIIAMGSNFFIPSTKTYKYRGEVFRNPSVNLLKIKTIEYLDDSKLGIFEIQFTMLSGEVKRCIYNNRLEMTKDKSALNRSITGN